MKTNLIVIGLIALLAVGCGQCNGSYRQYHKPTKYTWTVTMYSSTGSIIQEWTDIKRVEMSSNGRTCLYSNMNNFIPFVMVAGNVVCKRIAQNDSY